MLTEETSGRPTPHDANIHLIHILLEPNHVKRENYRSGIIRKLVPKTNLIASLSYGPANGNNPTKYNLEGRDPSPGHPNPTKHIIHTTRGPMKFESMGSTHSFWAVRTRTPRPPSYLGWHTLSHGTMHFAPTSYPGT